MKCEYAAPELVEDSLEGDFRYTKKSDLWMLGLIAHRLLIGVTPFYSSDASIMA
jgi:hypothetical protein